MVLVNVLLKEIVGKLRVLRKTMALTTVAHYTYLNPYKMKLLYFLYVHSCASVQEETNFQETREACLRSWIDTVFARQSCESAEYRLELRKFLSGN